MGEKPPSYLSHKYWMNKDYTEAAAREIISKNSSQTESKFILKCGDKEGRKNGSHINHQIWAKLLKKALKGYLYLWWDNRRNEKTR